MDDTETEFFGRSRGSGPGRAARARARREERRRLQPLRSSDPVERTRAATTLVEHGLDRNAAALCDFARDERDPGVLAALAEAVLTAPVVADPDRPEARLRDWALAQATRDGHPPGTPVDPAPATAPTPPAPAPATAPGLTSAPLVAERSPDDRWRAGSVPSRRVPSAPAGAPAAAAAPALAPAPRPAPAAAPDPVTPASPPVVGGTIGNGSRPRVVVAPQEPPSAAAPPAAAPPAAPAPAPAPSVRTAAPEQTAPAPAVRPAPGGPARPSTWRVVKARPVDIVVWDQVDSAGDAGNPQPAPSAIRYQDEEPGQEEVRRGVH